MSAATTSHACLTEELIRQRDALHVCLAALKAFDAYMFTFSSGPEADVLDPAVAGLWRAARAAIAKAEGR